MNSRCLLFLRVSTIQQDYEHQRIELIKYAKTKGYDDYLIIAHKESGIKLNEQERQGIEELKEMIERDSSISAVFIFEISRLARREEVLHSIKTYLVEKKINLYIYDKQYQLLNEDGSINEQTELLFTLYSYFASQEMKIKKIRMNAGKQRLKKDGKFYGGKLLYGFKSDKDNNILVDEEKLNNVKWIFNEYLNTDISIRQLGIECQRRGIIKTSNKRSAASWIKFMLTNYGYCGESDFVKYPVVIPKECIDKAKEKARNQARLPRETQNIYYCKSLLYNIDHKKTYVANRTDAKYCIRDPHHQLDINLMDSFIWDLTKNNYYPLYIRIHDTNVNKELDNELSIIEMKLTTINNKIEQLSKELTKLNDLYIKERLSENEYETRYNDNINSKAILSDSKRLLEQSRLTILQKKESALNRTGLIDIETLTNGLDDKQKYDLIHQTVKKVYISKKDGYIELLVENKILHTKDEYRMIDNEIYYYNDIHELNDEDEWLKYEFDIERRYEYIKRKRG